VTQSNQTIKQMKLREKSEISPSKRVKELSLKSSAGSSKPSHSNNRAAKAKIPPLLSSVNRKTQ
jgi:hypothetical protein